MSCFTTEKPTPPATALVLGLDEVFSGLPYKASIQGHRQGRAGPRPWFLAARPDNQGRARASQSGEALDPGPGPGPSIREALVPGPGPGLSIREALTPGPGRACVLGRSRSQGRAGPGLRPGIAGWFCLRY